MLFVRGDTPSKLLPNVNPSGDTENIFFKTTLRSKRWLILRSYNHDDLRVGFCIT